MKLEVSSIAHKRLVGAVQKMDNVSAIVVRTNNGNPFAIQLERDAHGPEEHVWLYTAEDPGFDELLRKLGMMPQSEYRQVQLG